MPPKQTSADAIDAAPLTAGGVVRWGGVVAAVVSVVVGIVWQLAAVRADIASDRAKAVEQDRRLTDIDKASADRHERQQREIDRNASRIDRQDATVADLSRKLDVAVAILERIEKQVGTKP